jgi:holliday junction DNA helicase RuvA
MIAYLQGKLVEKTPTYVVLDCNGIGYFLNISLHTYSKIPDVEHIKLYTHFIIREDAHILYGFWEKAEREIFILLLSVSGIGASIARTLLSSMSPIQLREAIASGDATSIQSVKGIGAKTAQRVIVDLKDKILKIYDIDEVLSSPNNTTKEEALSALEVLGFSRKQSEHVIDKILKNTPDSNVEAIIKGALKNM